MGPLLAKLSYFLGEEILELLKGFKGVHYDGTGVVVLQEDFLASR